MYEWRCEKNGGQSAFCPGVNVSNLFHAPQSAGSSPASGSIALFAAPAAPGALGAFSSLFGGLIGKGSVLLPGGTAPDLPVGPPARSLTSLSGKSKDKDAKGSEKNNGAAKKDEESKTAPVQTPEPAPALVHPMALLQPLTWEPHGANISETPPEPAPGGEADVPPIGASGDKQQVGGGANAWDTRGAAPVPDGSRPVSAARIAFALRLTPANREPNLGPSARLPDSPADFGQDSRLAFTPAVSSQVAARVPESRAPEIGLRDNDVRESKLATISLARRPGDNAPGPSETELAAENAPQRSSDVSPAPAPAADAVVENRAPQARAASATGDSQGNSRGARNPTPSEVQGRFSNSGRVTSEPTPKEESAVREITAVPAHFATAGQSNIDARKVPGEELPGGNGGNWLFPQRTPETSNSSARPDILAETGVNLQTEDSQTRSQDGHEPEPQPEEPARNATANKDGAPPIRNPSQERVIAASTQRLQRQGEEVDNSSPAPKVSRPPAAERREVASSSHNDGRGNSNTFAPGTQSVDGPGTIGSRAENSAADSLQEPKIVREPEIDATPRPQPARQISLKLTGADSTKVDVELTEKAGKVQVAVRTEDRELAKSLQSDLGGLVGRLESKGFKTEAWAPAESRHSPVAASEQSNFSNSQGDPRQPGSGTEHQQPGRQGQNGSNPRQQARWMAQLNQTISTEETRTEPQ